MIEIHIDGKPVTKLQAARAAANLSRGYESPDIRVGEPDEDGHVTRRYISVHARHHAYGDMQPAEVSWPSIGSQDAPAARTFAEMLALGAEVAELAEMLAAEQDADGPASTEAAAFDNGMHFTESLCPSELGLVGGGVLPCHLEVHHNGPHSDIDRTTQWVGTGSDARTIVPFPFPSMAEQAMRHALGYDRKTHLAWYERTHPGRREWPAEPRTEAATLAAVAAYSQAGA